MKYCYCSSTFVQTMLLVALFLTLILSLFLLLVDYGRTHEKWMPLPMCLLWSFTIAADVWMIWYIAGLRRLGRHELCRDSIKQALDMLPSGICYFTPSGNVKLCNRQMDSLFHTISQSNLQTLFELQEALSEYDSRTGVIRIFWEKETYLFSKWQSMALSADRSKSFGRR